MLLTTKMPPFAYFNELHFFISSFSFVTDNNRFDKNLKYDHGMEVSKAQITLAR